MQKVLSYPVSAVYLIFFGLALLAFHPVQWLCLNLFGYEAHKKSVSLLNLVLMRCTHLLGTRYRFETLAPLPEKGPVILVANHQSMYDIPPIIWHFRKFHPKFVSKKELGRGIPSVSYNLRHGGSVLIDRKDRRQSLQAIRSLGGYIESTGRSAVIFPEGTRSRTGEPKPFRTVGLEALVRAAPSALILPVTINNSWKMLRFGKFPLGLGNCITFTIHQAVPPEPTRIAETLAGVEHTITSHIRWNP